MTIAQRWHAWVSATLFMAGAAVHAHDPTIDPPDRVARISYVHGDVKLQPASGGDWQAAPLNRPLVASERLATTGSSLVELDLGTAALRLGGTGELMLSDGNPTHPRFALPTGALAVTVRSLSPGATIEIDTDLVALLINRPGRYRVAASDVASVVQVTEGSIDAYGSTRAPMTLKAGQRYRFGAADFSKLAVGPLPATDAFDRWSTTRDMRYNAPATTQYVSQDMVGYQDLDTHGQWQQDADLGAIWYPNDVAANWAPYSDGNWSFIAPWGWTWIDRHPWGFAPSHYGRWSHERGRWGWVPGARTMHSTYAPAAIASLPASSFPEIRAAQRAQVYGSGSAPQTVMPGAPRPPRPPQHGAGPAHYNVLQVPARIVRTDPATNRASMGASARPGLSFIAPEPGNLQQRPPAHFVDSSPNQSPAPAFQQSQPQTVIRSDRGSYNGFQPSIDYARTPIRRPGYGNGGGEHHDRPPVQSAPVSHAVLQMPSKTSAPAATHEAPTRQAPTRGDASEGR